MNVQRISNKASVFLNHKHFHPGNSKNREKVWLAEEKLKEEERKQEELLKKRKKEWEIEELRRDLRESYKKVKGELKAQPEVDEVVDKNKQLHDVLVDKTRLSKSWVKSDLYEEDVFLGNHSSVWGSYYDPNTRKWGFKCCKSLKRSSVCSAYGKSKLQISKSFDSSSTFEPCIPSIGDRSKFGISEYNNDSGGPLLLNGGKPFSKQRKGVSEFLSLLKQSQSKSSN
ncbi:step ii splicing factor [Cryptosporidium sp. chipmunk genotype I]|uniref:step ii splicing factor n=1 Tax=Cryptosporidium sp. chipmunk genotype I TaxID=1280935 RepID=UPI003519F8F0|nr:step ii splicing factor [Cryptosporidium sp. chipmunk genotype I]